MLLHFIITASQSDHPQKKNCGNDAHIFSSSEEKARYYFQGHLEFHICIIILYHICHDKDNKAQTDELIWQTSGRLYKHQFAVSWMSAR